MREIVFHGLDSAERSELARMLGPQVVHLETPPRPTRSLGDVGSVVAVVAVAVSTPLMVVLASVAVWLQLSSTNRTCLARRAG
jgi:hypothetical protein